MANDEHLQDPARRDFLGGFLAMEPMEKGQPQSRSRSQSGGASEYGFTRGGSQSRGPEVRATAARRPDRGKSDRRGSAFRRAEGRQFTRARLTHATVDPAALKRTVNARIDAAEQKGATWKLTRGGESLPFTEIYQRLRNLITACRCRLSKLAPGLFEHEELVTLGLSQQSRTEKTRSPLGATLNPNQRANRWRTANRETLSQAASEGAVRFVCADCARPRRERLMKFDHDKTQIVRLLHRSSRSRIMASHISRALPFLA